jgi:hypothetical protein
MIRCLILVIVSPLHVQLHQESEWERANLATVRMEPTAFLMLPASIKSDLSRRGCTVPQPFTQGALQNVISGHFFTAAETDWAVLCSRNLTSSILVYRRGETDSVAELGSRPDKDFLQVTAAGEIGYSRAIVTATPAYIRGKGGLAKPATITHDGINDLFVEKGSTVRFWHEGQWLELPGAD